MIIILKCNLAVLLAERNLKITQVSKDTGISRTTLTSLSYNNSQGIQLDTLNKLCIYLQVTPEELFVYMPFDYSLCSKQICKNKCEIEITIKTYNQKFITIFLADFITISPFELQGSFYSNCNVTLYLKNDLKADPLSSIAIKYIKSLPPILKNDFKSQVSSEVVGSFEGDTKFFSSWVWPDELN